MSARNDDVPAKADGHPGAGDRQFDQLYRDHAWRLQRRVGARIRSADEAHDIVHEAFARLIGARFVGELRAPEAFLNRIVRNLLIDRTRRLVNSARHVPLEADVAPVTPPAQTHAIEVAQMREQYRAAVAALPDRMRTVFILHRVEGVSYKEIAARLGISTRTAEWHVAQAIVRISKGLDMA